MEWSPECSKFFFSTILVHRFIPLGQLAINNLSSLSLLARTFKLLHSHVCDIPKGWIGRRREELSFIFKLKFTRMSTVTYSSTYSLDIHHQGAHSSTLDLSVYLLIRSYALVLFRLHSSCWNWLADCCAAKRTNLYGAIQTLTWR